MKATLMIIVWLGLSPLLGAQSSPPYKEQIRAAFAQIEQDFERTSPNQYQLIEMDIKVTGSAQMESPLYEDHLRVISRGNEHYFWSNIATVFQDSKTTVSVDARNGLVQVLNTPGNYRRDYLTKQFGHLNDTLLELATVVSVEEKIIQNKTLQEITLSVPDNNKGMHYSSVVFYLDDGKLFRSKAFYTKPSAYQSVEVTFVNYQTSYSPEEPLTDPISMVRHADGRLKEPYNQYTWNDLR